jgi:hypothetical protein
METRAERADEGLSRPCAIGIDLGTTNCAVAWADLAGGVAAGVADFPVPQLQGPGEVASRPLLPSFLYLPADHEFAPGTTQLPWGGEAGPIVGEWARAQGARVPGRLVASAKSWLCHPGVDRAAAILPWGAAPDAMGKLSPVEATTHLLAHLVAAWDHAHPETPLARQEVVVTVPASFDEVARTLTAEAARRAGLPQFTLLEEPQAAFYDFLARHRGNLAGALGGIRLILVIDVGGGTTDFSLLQVEWTPNGSRLRRLAVGDHLLLGGDNMDAALAHWVEDQWRQAGHKLGAAQWNLLVQAARAAKEALLGEAPPESYRLAVAGAGSRLLGGTLTATISRAEAERLILDGFLPHCAAEDAPGRLARMALQELGLPYAKEPAITRHLAAFLREHAAAGQAALAAETSLASPPLPPAVVEQASSLPPPAPLPRPDALLLNGGVFQSERLVRRLAEVVSSWWPDAPPIRLLPHGSLSLAVARGAAHYGRVRHGQADRIRGGAAQAFYVGLGGGKEATANRAVCVLPRGHEPGDPVDLRERPFQLTLGRPVQLPWFSTTADRPDRPGDVVEVDDSFHALPPIHTLFRGAGRQPTAVAVHLRALLTELGTLELWCVANERDERWRLEFDLRGASTRTAPSVAESLPARLGDVRAVVQRAFGPEAAPTPGAEGREAKQLWAALERLAGPRDSWRLPWLRELWGALFAGAKRRRRSPAHERVFYQLAGYALRPGFGYPLDDWRSAQTFGLLREGVVHAGEAAVWNEFWVMWRRLAGGLEEAAQQELWNLLKPHLARRLPMASVALSAGAKIPRAEGWHEMVRTAASLEHLEVTDKILLGEGLAGRLRRPDGGAGPWAWALGRVGARVPLYGSSHKTVPPEPAATWVALLLELGLAKVEHAAFAAAQLARCTGDRARDLDPDLRTEVAAALRQVAAPEHWLRLVTEVVALETAEEARALGDSLPVGLRLR